MFIASSTAGEKHFMNLAQETIGKREFVLPQAIQAVVHSPDIIGDLDYIAILGNAGRVRSFESHQVRDGGLGSFDLRRKHGFLADIGIQEKAGIG